MNKNRSLFILLIISAVNIFLTASDNTSDNKILFNFGIIQKDQNQMLKRIELGKTKDLTAKDKICIFINPVKNVFIYLYLVDSENSLSLLFPDNIDFFNNAYKTGNSYFLPAREKWYDFDENKGIEKFILLASPNRLGKLEELTKKHQNLIQQNKVEKKEIIIAKQDVLDEIAKIKMTNSKFIVFAEKPTVISGTVRGIKDDFKELLYKKELVYKIEAEKFYSKSIELEHE
jgi:hypothetical protein